MKWYAIAYNQHGQPCYKTPEFLNRQQAIYTVEVYVRNNPGTTYQLFQA